MGIIIEKSSYFLPDTIVSNQDLEQERPGWKLESTEAKSGIKSRHIASENETALDLAIKAVEKLIKEEGLDLKEVDGIVFCTQSPNYILPSNAFLIHAHFDFKEEVVAFDYNLACSGFVYGLGIIRGLIETGLCTKVLLINADTYSKFIHPGDKATRVLFGDSAAASIIGNVSSDSGIQDIKLATSGKMHEAFMIPAGGAKTPFSSETKQESEDQSGNITTPENIQMNGFAVWKFISKTVPIQIKGLLKKNNLEMEDIDLFVFHQASKLTLDSLIKALKIPKEKAFMNMENIGNNVSASIPIAIKDAEDSGKLSRGDLILISGFGVGLSWGSILMKY